MRAKNKRVGDIYYNPMFMDLWILNKRYWYETKKDEWVLNLVNDDLEELLKYVEGFVKVGNIYDMVIEKMGEKNK